MSLLSPLESTLFVPLQGRLYASHLFPDVLHDREVLKLEPFLRKEMAESASAQSRQTEYTMLAGAVRAANLDREAADFLNEHPDGIVVDLGAGLDTGFYRCPLQEKALWVEVDSPAVLKLREKLFGHNARDLCLAGDARGDGWLRSVRRLYPTAPVLVLAGGLSYFLSRDEMRELCGMLKDYGVKRLVFDAVNGLGYRMSGHYLKQVGHADLKVSFFLSQNQEKWRRAIGAQSIRLTKYYRSVPKCGMKLSTRLTMTLSDWLGTVKMVRIDF